VLNCVFLRQEIHIVECLHLLLYKITQVQITKEGDDRRMYFCDLSSQAVHDNVFGQKFTFFNDKAWFHWSGYVTAQIGTEAVLI
jgi:hypothetical protein